MKNKTLLIAVLIIIITLIIVTPVSASLILKERWTRDVPEYKVAISPDGNYVASGSEYTDKARNFHFYNKNGDVLWDRYFAQGIEDMAILSSGETIIGDQRGKVYRFDKNGNLEWTYETEGEMEIATNGDGNPIYYEGSYKFGKLNSQGIKLWEKSTLSSAKGYWDISTTSRGDRLVLDGYEFGTNPLYVFITMYDGDGSKLWEKAIVESVRVRINSIGTRVIAAGKNNLYNFDGTGNLIDTVNIKGNSGVDITDNLIATTGNSGTFLLDYKGNILNKIPRTGYSIDISSDEKYLIVGSFSGVSFYGIEQDSTNTSGNISENSATVTHNPPSNQQSFPSIFFIFFILAIGTLIFIFYRKRETRLEEYHSKMEEWENEGYDVTDLKRVMRDKK